jgi:hypothetical protein
MHKKYEVYNGLSAAAARYRKYAAPLYSTVLCSFVNSTKLINIHTILFHCPSK